MNRFTQAVMARRALVLSLCASLAACGGGEDDRRLFPETGPVYVGATRVFTPDDSIGYLFATTSLDEGEVDLSHAFEIDDAWVFGDADPYFYTATIFSPEITRWTLGDDGRFVRGPTVSFVNAGVGGTYTAALTDMASPTRSYFADSESMSIVVWNPSTMEFLETIEIPAEDIEGYFPWIYLVVREDDLVANVYYQSDDIVRFQPFVRTYVVDRETETIVETHDDDRCESLGIAGKTSDGTIYYSAVDYDAVIRQVYGQGYGAGSCALRMQGDEQELDSTFALDLSSLVGGKPAGSAYLLNDTELLFHVWDDSLISATPENFTMTRFEPAYTWYRWTIGSATATALPDQMPSSEGGEFRRIDGGIYSFGANAEYSETTLARFGADGRFTPGLRVRGWIVNMIKAR